MIVHDEGEIPSGFLLRTENFKRFYGIVGLMSAPMRGVGELKHLLKNDFVTATTILEQRMLIGSREIADGIDAVIEYVRKNYLSGYLQYKLEEMRERRREAGASPFCMEPNLKTSPGHLRDIQLLRNIILMCTGSRNIHELTGFGSMTFPDVTQILQTTDMLLKLRHLQHFYHGKRKDDWSLRDQVRIAEELGYVTSGRLAGVEIMMKEHYKGVRHVNFVVDEVWDELREPKNGQTVDGQPTAP